MLEDIEPRGPRYRGQLRFTQIFSILGEAFLTGVHFLTLDWCYYETEGSILRRIRCFDWIHHMDSCVSYAATVFPGIPSDLRYSFNPGQPVGLCQSHTRSSLGLLS
jgi:hypothetical protein